MYHFYNSQITFDDFYSLSGLKKIDKLFLEFLKTHSKDSLDQLLHYRTLKKFNSAIVLQLAPLLENFILEIFSLQDNAVDWQKKHAELGQIFICRQKFIQRQVTESDFNEAELEKAKIMLSKKNISLDDDLALAKFTLDHFTDDAVIQPMKSLIAWGLFKEHGRQTFKNSILLAIPQKLDFDNLLHTATLASNHIVAKNFGKRSGFTLKQNYLPENEAITQANYCLFCHDRGKDSCSKGLLEKRNPILKKNPLNIKLSGCPLEQKISEMNLLKKQGILIGALATAMLDNPMLAATGHRICNDCMKSCIFQKQEPVNIPLIESKVFDEILRLPYGFEIYNLLTQWNPLKSTEFLPSPVNNKNVLVVGMGPAGFTLAHYLTHGGFTVVGIDGLKQEPLAAEVTGLKQTGDRQPFHPIKQFTDIEEDLCDRKAYGFGGVAEYGITVRWNKNYLTVLRIILERRNNFRLYGSTRFGSSITYNNAQKLGFQHVALAMGAGKPQLPNIGNMLVKGIRTASDFLMALHSQNPNQSDIPSNLQIRLPIIVVGGGLTSVDTATESLFYYAELVEKYLQMIEKTGEKFIQTLSEEDQEIAYEYINHAKELRQNADNKLKLLLKWGGAKILYRKKLTQSPAYRLNHEELDNALKEGVQFVAETSIKEIILDKYGSAKAINSNNGILPAATILIATGTVPNITIAREDPHHFKQDGQFLAMENDIATEDNFFILRQDNFSMSVHGDQHKNYSGSVVKAMASAKNSYQQITSKLMEYQSSIDAQTLFEKLDKLLIATVTAVNRLTNNAIELVVKAKLAAAEFKPGQFYRLQNYHMNAVKQDNLTYQMEPLAMTGSFVNKETGEISLIILEMGGSSDFCQSLKIGEVISLMGPTGSPTFIPHNEKVILIGGGLGNAVLFSIGAALLQNNCQVLYFAAYRKNTDVFKREMIESASDEIIWCCEDGTIEPSRKQDKSFSGNVIEALQTYPDLTSFKHILTIGSDGMMHAVAELIYHAGSNLFHPQVKAIASINSPMQCMMKEICAQCLQKHIDPITEKVSFKYSCFNQDQDMSGVDFANLKCRLQQNRLLEITLAKYLQLKKVAL
jgi:NADPH-dependent glutamate synthase beta subunit-like oxidoreductase/NAD(P)H-flavin reductase